MEVESLMNEILIACHSTDTKLLQKFLTFAKLRRDMKSRNKIYSSAYEVSSFAQTDIYKELLNTKLYYTCIYLHLRRILMSRQFIEY